eukprot:NODE_4749_length_1119_cov_80.985944_g4213_i0.p1 GENE.NODE_4749_length_1119_cov_80.985944_g4213_i0~~NODE_4749_length_1119_cov_80.985944_g4213_i0.p1  ORF type:complete len:347 (+),score=89.58 NODE_4749_length_1119_cov_80.985944_g4213_i0:46-1041(+)
MPKKTVFKAAEDKEFSKKKIIYFERANNYFDEYDKILVVLADNVQSRQLQDIRIALRGKAQVLMGKNTRIRKVLKDRLKDGSERNETLYRKLVTDGLLRMNIGLIFTNGDLSDIKSIVDANKIQAPARVGSVAPLDVIVPAGNTGMEPTKTSFFQALNIGTKITKGTVEILKDEHIIKVGEKVGSSEATLLQMLGIKPFFYGMQILNVYDQGSVYGREVLEMTEEDKRDMFKEGISNITALSLALGFPTKASFPHVFLNGFKNLLAIGVTADFSFPKGEQIIKDIKEGKKAPAAPAPAKSGGAPAAKKEEPKKEEPKEEEEDGDMGFGLFD